MSDSSSPTPAPAPGLSTLAVHAGEARQKRASGAQATESKAAGRRVGDGEGRAALAVPREERGEHREREAQRDELAAA